MGSPRRGGCLSLTKESNNYSGIYKKRSNKLMEKLNVPIERRLGSQVQQENSSVADKVFGKLSTSGWFSKIHNQLIVPCGLCLPTAPSH